MEKIGYLISDTKLDFIDIGDPHILSGGPFGLKLYTDLDQIKNQYPGKTGGYFYVLECELEKPIKDRDLLSIFDTYSDAESFYKNHLGKEELGPIEERELREKIKNLDGQYELIDNVSRLADLSLIELCRELGFDSIYGPGYFIITDSNQALSFMEVDHNLSEDEIEERRLPAEEELEEKRPHSVFETTSNQYIQSTKKGPNYKTKPGNRFSQRVYIKMNGGNSTWFDIDMNRLFKADSFAIKIPVVGETDEYVDTISFTDWLDELKNDIAKTGFNQLTIKRSLSHKVRFSNLKIKCTCPDFHYRFSYVTTVRGDIEGDPQTIPSPITNPRDDLGKLCKHLACCLNNKVWLDKESRIIYNYLVNLKRSQPALFNKIVAPKLGLDIGEEKKENQENSVNNPEGNGEK